MQNLINELKKVIPFKETTAAGDIIIIAAKQPQMLAYGYVREIERDSTRKDEWWHVHFTFLSVPPQHVTWTLRTPQMTGQEVFTMGGEERFVKAVDLGHRPQPDNTEPVEKKGFQLKRVK
jgi:hypothetical protein